jgi:anti-sigma B factor antagonist
LSIVPLEWSTFAVTSSFVDGRRTVHVSGELDLATRDVVHGACVVDGGRHVTVDLGAITFLDCSGVTGLLAARHQLERRGGSLTLVDAVGQPARLLAMLGEVELPSRVALRSVPG